MRPFSLSELVLPLQGELLDGDANFDGVSIDSRAIAQGELFVALAGEHFDGHQFLSTVAQQGAAAAMVMKADTSPLPVLKVSDTRSALGRLAALNRQHFEGPLIGITGSCGKTSVKNMLAAVCGGCGETLSTPGNHNNEIGLPLTLLQLQPAHRYAVIEMGAARQGDIRYLSDLAKPQVAVLLNAQAAHLEGFGSIDGVAQAKGEILAGLQGSGTAIFPADSEYSDLWRELAGDASCLRFGFDSRADVYAENVMATEQGSSFQLFIPGGECQIELPWIGHHNVANALATAAAAIAAGIELDAIASGLNRSRPESGRLLRLLTPVGVQLIDDSYNANPGSVAAAIDVLAASAGRRLLVLGSMAELGDDSVRLHQQVGAYAAECGIDELWATGPYADAAVAAFGAHGHYFAELDQLLEMLPTVLHEDDKVLVKGSRSAGMERVVDMLMNRES